MKKNELIRKGILFLSFGMLLAFTSCKKDDPKPVAEFSFEISTTNLLEVAFANESKDATSYTWDFGDESTSTEESPTHAYADYGTYTVTLTAKGDGGTAEVSYDVELIDPGIVIDGNFDDWTDIPAIASYPDGEGRTLTELRVSNNETFLFFYIKGTANIGQVLQIYIDADADSATGWDYWNFFEAPGIEYLMETVIVGWETPDVVNPGSKLAAATGPDSNWPWVDVIASNAMYSNSGYIVSGDSKIIELALLKDMFTTPALSSKIRIVVGNSDNTWTNVGHLPPSATDPLTPPVTYTMK
jgi:hypothetical protein